MVSFPFRSIDRAVVHSSSCIPRVSAPRYRSDLYSGSWLGQSNADGSETRPAGSRGTKSSPELCLPSPDWGFHELHHILNALLLFLSNSFIYKFCTKREKYPHIWFNLTSALSFPCCVLGGEGAGKLKITQTWSSCVTSLMKAFLTHIFPIQSG